MATAEDFSAVEDQIDDLRAALKTITAVDWNGYVKVRDILARATDLMLADGSASEHTASCVGHPKVARCAMTGVFEPASGSGTTSGYDPAAVQRFADLGG